MADGERVLTRDRSSGRVHSRVRDGSRLLSDERCNLDQAGAYEVIGAAELEGVDASALCRLCFPRIAPPEAPA